MKEPFSQVKKRITENMKEYKKLYYNKNKTNYYEKLNCDICNEIYIKSNKSNHLKSKKHKFNEMEKKLSEMKKIMNI